MGRCIKFFLPLGMLLSVFAADAYGHGIAEATARPGWHWRPDVLIVLATLGTVYVRGWLGLRRQSALAVSTARLASYLGALGILVIALLSPMDALSSSYFSVHMEQHLLLIMLAPLFLLLANPLAVFLWGLPRRARRALGGLLRRGSTVRVLLRTLTSMPVAWTVYVVNLWAWHHPFLYQAALTHSWVHNLEHLLFFLTAVLFWWPIVNPAPRLHGTASYGFRVAYLIAATMQNTVLGMVISLPPRVLYPYYKAVPGLQELSPIQDQALGGGIMWVSGHMYLIPILFLVAALLKAEDKSLAHHPSGSALTRARG